MDSIGQQGDDGPTAGRQAQRGPQGRAAGQRHGEVSDMGVAGTESPPACPGFRFLGILLCLGLPAQSPCWGFAVGESSPYRNGHLGWDTENEKAALPG